MHLGSLQFDMDFSHFFLFLSEVALDHFIRAKIPKNRNIL